MRKYFVILISVSVFTLLIMWIPELIKLRNQTIKEVEFGHIIKENVQTESIQKPKPQIHQKDTINVIIVSPSEKKVFDIKEFITWIIGSVNALFGTIVLGKKVFGKTK